MFVSPLWILGLQALFTISDSQKIYGIFLSDSLQLKCMFFTPVEQGSVKPIYISI